MRRSAKFDRLLVGLAALAGLAGVALSAAAAHLGTGATLDTAARFLLVHAAAVMALVALVASGVLRAALARIAAWILLVGLVVFCGDLSVRALAAMSPVPMAAPIGGGLLLLGWLVAALSAVLPPVPGGQDRGLP